MGLTVYRKKDSDGYVLVVKGTKEVILTAKLKGGFKIYIVPISLDDCSSYGLVSAFFDDYDEPLSICTPLFAQSEGDFASEMLRFLDQEHCDVFFFDEHSRELLGYQARIDHPTSNPRLKMKDLQLAHMSQISVSPRFWGQVIDHMNEWFGNRTPDDDFRALSIEFTKPRYPEDLIYRDHSPEVNSYHGRRTAMETVLHRDDAGHFGELDIVNILLRVFPSEQIYLGPLRVDDHRELADHLVVTPQNIFLIQAKDSPNTAQMLQRSIDRKKWAAFNQVERAFRQMRGSISYLRECAPLRIWVNDEEREINLGDRQIYGLVIVKELFLEDYSKYSELAFSVFWDTSIPCVFLDYPDFHQWTMYRRTENALVHSIDGLVEEALMRDEFPQFRLWPNDAIAG